MKQTVIRRDDMSQCGKLTLHCQADGDVIVSVYSQDYGFIGESRSVEFCNVTLGGGRSPHTLKALKHLMYAMELDNKERPINEET